jgi:tol-pal system protein YbgF
MSIKRVVNLVLVAAVLGLFPGLYAGTKEEIIRLQKDVLSLQAQIRELQRATDENSTAFKTQLEQLAALALKTASLLQGIRDSVEASQSAQKAAISDLTTELKSLNARLDETHNRIGTLAEQYAETRMQVEALKNPPRLLLASGDPSQPVSPDQVYLAAYNDYMQGNYEVAIQGFQAYLAHYRDSELADNAQFYIGECYFSQKKLEEAVLSFDQVINLYPKGDKVPAAYLKKGLCLLDLQKNEDAVVQFKHIVVTFSQSPEMHIARQQLELLGINVDELMKKTLRKKGG